MKRRLTKSVRLFPMVKCRLAPGALMTSAVPPSPFWLATSFQVRLPLLDCSVLPVSCVPPKIVSLSVSRATE